MRVKEGYALRMVADTGVIVALNDMDCSHLMTLNQTGIELWNMLQSDTEVTALVEGITNQYEVSQQTAEIDILNFLDKLRKAGLLDE